MQFRNFWHESTFQQRSVEMTSYLTVIKNAVYKDGHLTKAFQKEKRDTASLFLQEYANRNWSSR